MGFHYCQFCEKAKVTKEAADAMRFSPYSDKDIVLLFSNGHLYSIPHDGLLHYVTVHNYQPPQQFIDDVMEIKLEKLETLQTKGAPIEIGFLTETTFQTGPVPEGFVEKLVQMIESGKAMVIGSFGL